MSMIRPQSIALFCLVALLGLGAMLAQPLRAAPASQSPAAQSPQIDFGDDDNVIELKRLMSPYRAPGGAEADGSLWYMLNVSNDTVRPAIRVLIAGQPPRMAMKILPRGTRPAILAIASSDSGVLVEPAPAYGHRAWRVTVPPVTSVALALRINNAEAPPSVLAWTEPALSSHNRQLAIFITAVGTLIAAGALITLGLAILIGHAAPRWVAITLFMLLWSWLAGTGMFDASLSTRIGGPYGLTAFLTVLTLAAGARLADAIIPVREIWPKREKQFHRALYVLCGLGALAWLGIPGATLATNTATVLGSAAVAAYLVLCGRKGVKAAQVVAPSAAAFALVALAGAVTTLGGLGEGLAAPAATGGFAAAGAILLAMAVIASEEIAVLPFLHGSGAARLLEAPTAEGGGAATPFANLALAAIGAAQQGVFDLDFRAQLLTLSPHAAAMLGLGAHEATLSHVDWISHLHPDDRGAYQDILHAQESRPGETFRLEFRCSLRGGEWRWLELRASVVTDQDVPSDCLGLLSDITDRKLAPPPPRDALTGLGTRAGLMEELEMMGEGLAGATLALLDLDRFKAIHASLGDAGGDTMLLQTARRLEQRFGNEAHIFRTGGDGFALLFGSAPLALQTLGDELVELCNPPHPYEGRSIFAPASVGVESGAKAPIMAMRQAERALGAAKKQGGACAKVYHENLDADAPHDAVALEADLRRALDEKQIDVFYQPIMRLSDRAVVGFEALLRWHHPEKGLVSPADFIAHSEETGLIVALGRFALERAAHDLAQWQRYFPMEPALFASVNLSRRQLRDSGFEYLLGKTLAASQIAPGSLRLEVTESAVEADPDLAAMLSRIRAAGAGLSIDDFGTGASSLSQFRNLPFDTVKIDKSFLVREGDAGHGAGVVLNSIIALVHDLGRAVVVEGVENESDATWIRSLGCEFGQGYYFSAPLSAAAALAFIARHYDVTAATPS